MVLGFHVARLKIFPFEVLLDIYLDHVANARAWLICNLCFHDEVLSHQ